MITLNGVSLATIGFVADRGRRLPGLGRRQVMASLPGASRGVMLGSVVEPDQITVPGWFRAASHAEVQSRRDSLAALLRGEVVIRFSDITDREWVGRATDQTRTDAIGPDWITDRHSALLVFDLADPCARAQAETSVGGLNPSLALGTAPSFLRVAVQNGAGSAITRVVIRIRDASNAVLRELQWDGNVASGEALVVSADQMAVTNDGVNAVDGLTAASEFPVADPAEGADDVQVVVTGGTGVTVTTSYRRRWWG